MIRLPKPIAMDSRYVVLTPDQWGAMCARRFYGRLNLPYVPAFSEDFGRHVIVVETLGM